jgi:hypothetical protein
MITFAPFPEVARDERPRPRLPILPLVTLTTTALLFTTSLPGWARMWLIAFALFAGFKWWTWRRALQTGARPAITRSLAYLLLWPGMNARAFLTTAAKVPVARTTCCPGSREPISREQEVTPSTAAWTFALTKTLLGATLLWVIARLAGHGLLAGWIGMIGLIFLLHFGLFALLALFWQSRGLNAAPLMNCPIAATSLHDFWGRRWNAGFRDIVFALFFLPLARRFNAAAAALITFLLSGLIHELVITVPAGAGYGLPTLYFGLQGAGLMLERQRRRAACRLTRGWPGRLFTLAVVALPIPALFPPVFVEHVMVPFFQLIHAL